MTCEIISLNSPGKRYFTLYDKTFKQNNLKIPIKHFFKPFNKLWKSLKEMGIPNHLTCLLRNLYADQEETVRIGHGTMDWFKTGKGVCQGCILSP